MLRREGEHEGNEFFPSSSEGGTADFERKPQLRPNGAQFAWARPPILLGQRGMIGGHWGPRQAGYLTSVRKYEKTGKTIRLLVGVHLHTARKPLRRQIRIRKTGGALEEYVLPS